MFEECIQTYLTQIRSRLGIVSILHILINLGKSPIKPFSHKML